MVRLSDYPLLLFVICFIILAFAAFAGRRWTLRRKELLDEASETFGVVQAASLTLLALLIGFTFSMAISRYDQRKTYEEEEANAIGTEMARLDLIDEKAQPLAKTLLTQYLQQRIAFYQAPNEGEATRVRTTQAGLETKLWQTVVDASRERRDPITGLAVAGMNDVLNASGYTQAAWWNRIPRSAWLLLLVLGAFANLLVGMGAKNARKAPSLLVIMPFFAAMSFAFIADIDAPRGGLIRVVPQNLIAVMDSLKPAP